MLTFKQLLGELIAGTGLKKTDLASRLGASTALVCCWTSNRHNVLIPFATLNKLLELNGLCISKAAQDPRVKEIYRLFLSQRLAREQGAKCQPTKAAVAVMTYLMGDISNDDIKNITRDSIDVSPVVGKSSVGTSQMPMFADNDTTGDESVQGANN